MMMPTSENSELSQPAVAESMLNVVCSSSIQGATLFCTKARETPAKMVAKATIHARFVFIGFSSFSYAPYEQLLDLPIETPPQQDGGGPKPALSIDMRLPGALTPNNRMSKRALELAYEAIAFWVSGSPFGTT